MSNPASIEFKAKVQSVYNCDGTLAWQYVKVPAITRSHCDMPAFRKHGRMGPYANSDLFPAFIRRALEGLGVKETIRLDRIPESVNLDASGFLARVTITIPA